MNGQQRDQGRNQKIPWKKWEWEHNNPKPVGHRDSNPKRKLALQAYLKKEQRLKKEKAQINDLTSHLKELEKEQQSPKRAEGRK